MVPLFLLHLSLLEGSVDWPGDDLPPGKQSKKTLFREGGGTLSWGSICKETYIYLEAARGCLWSDLEKIPPWPRAPRVKGMNKRINQVLNQFLFPVQTETQFGMFGRNREIKI